MNMGLRKRLSFSAIRAKHKPSLNMLACESKQLPYRFPGGGGGVLPYKGLLGWGRAASQGMFFGIFVLNRV